MNEKQFATLPSRTIFIKFVVPSILSMVFSSLYMIVDGIFVGNLIGSNALAAINMIMPMMGIIFATSNMLAVGSSVKVSIALGKKDFKKANEIFSTSLLAISILGIILVAILFVFKENVLSILIKDDILKPLANQYISIFIYFLPLALPLFAMDNFTRACGKAKYNMYINIAVSLINIFLDYLLIYVLGGGITSAAIASCISMTIGVLLLYTPFIMGKNTLKFVKPTLPIKEIFDIMYLGVSDFLNSSAGAIVGIIINTMLLKFGGANGVAAYGIAMYLNGLVFSIIYGMADSITPAISYNYGAKNIEKTKELFSICVKFAMTVSFILFIALEVAPTQIASLFVKNGDIEVISLTSSALKIIAISYAFVSMNIIYNCFLVAFDMARVSMIVMILNSIIFPISSIFILTNVLDLQGIFIAAPVSAILTFIFASYFYCKARKKINLSI